MRLKGGFIAIAISAIVNSQHTSYSEKQFPRVLENDNKKI